MKYSNLIAVGLLLAATSAQALLVEGDTMMCKRGDYWALCATVLTTISLPTMLVDGQDMDMSSDQASQRFVSEASGDTDLVLIPHLASVTHHTPEEVTQAIFKLLDLKQEVSANAIVEFLK